MVEEFERASDQGDLGDFNNQYFMMDDDVGDGLGGDYEDDDEVGDTADDIEPDQFNDRQDDVMALLLALKNKSIKQADLE